MANTVTFIPCCNPGESIIFIDTAPLLSTNLVNGAIYRYTLGTILTGQGLGPLGIDTVDTGQCYTLIFGVTASIYPTLPNYLLFTNFASTGNSCLDQVCINACALIPPEPVTNIYLQYVPCCADSGPTLYYRVPAINVPIDGVASYVGTINSNPYPTTDVNCNFTTSLVSNKCYSITQHTVGVGQPVSTATQYNCLAIAPQDISGNYIWYSPTTPTLWDSDCQKFVGTCPDCNPLCFTLWSCDGSQPLFTTSTDLTAFVGLHITVSSVDPLDNIVDLCVFVQDTTQFNCTNVIDVVVTSNSCICDCTCYTVTGNIKSIEYIDCFGNYVLIPDPGVSTSTFCTQTYPIVFSRDGTTTITNNGDCSETSYFDAELCEEVSEYVCIPPACYLLEDCNDNTNVIYSNSPSLALPANLGQVVTIVGHTECWKILIPQECICPINVTVLTTSACCLTCLPNINYKLTSCEDPLTFVYTSNDLSLYVDRVVKREECPGCWKVTEIDGGIPTDVDVTVIEDYLDCEKCNRKYYLLQDCLGLELDIITYTDLSNYVDKVITLDWCPETCWEITETIEDVGAGIISDILNSYTECIDCLTNAPCICSTIKNYNDIALDYQYLNCEGILQTITLQPGQKSDRLCLIRWYAPEPCDELIVTITSSIGVVSNIIVYQSSVNHPGPVLVNDKPTWYDIDNNLYIYYDGTKWILSKNLAPLVLPSVYTTIGFINCSGDCDCPTGTWQQSSSIPNQDIYVTTDFKYTIEYFGNCINGVCPPRKNKQKSVTPGYDTPGCEAWKYEEISCRAAEAMYKQVLYLRYGISNCCPDEDEQYIVQKELIDLAALNDPAYPCSTNSCGCSCDCDCSTTEPVCPVIPLTYNCSNGNCNDPGDGSGEYSTLALCQENCVPPVVNVYTIYTTFSAFRPNVSYDCFLGVCADPGDGSGVYPTLLACDAACTFPPPNISYNCLNGNCTDPGDGSGVYATLIECENVCTDPPQVSYDCFRGICSDPGDGSGVYPTLIACEEECVPEPPIPTCSVFTNIGNAVYAYFPSSNTNIFLSSFLFFPASPDIAHTTTKLWMYDGLLIYEMDITLNPWSATFNRTIAFPSFVILGAGLGAITNTQLISTNTNASPHQIIVLDITTSTAVSTVIGTLKPGRTVSGDILLTTTNKILVTNQGNDGIFLSQYSYPSGTFEVEVNITSTITYPWGIFIDSGNIYVCNVNGEMYNVNVNFPYTQTLFNNSGLTIAGASQVPSCCNANLIVEPSVTTYNCVNGDCVLVSGSGGQYPTLLACQAACRAPEVNTIYTTFDII
jgi:hypothetical protein